MSEPDKDSIVNAELMEDLLSDQAAIRARLDQVETELRHNGAALMMTIVAVLLVGAAVYLLVRELDEKDES